MNKLLIAAMMMAALTACSQEAKQESKEAATALASGV